MDKESQDKCNQDLLLAAENRQWGSAKRLISLGADINTSLQSEIFSGCTVVWLAAYCSKWDFVREYYNTCNMDIHPNVGFLGGITIAWLAAIEHEWTLLSKIYLNINLDTYPNNKPGYTVIYIAADHYK